MFLHRECLKTEAVARTARRPAISKLVVYGQSRSIRNGLPARYHTVRHRPDLYDAYGQRQVSTIYTVEPIPRGVRSEADFKNPLNLRDQGYPDRNSAFSLPGGSGDPLLDPRVL